jgi:hypothetical protein
LVADMQRDDFGCRGRCRDRETDGRAENAAPTLCRRARIAGLKLKMLMLLDLSGLPCGLIWRAASMRKA